MVALISSALGIFLVADALAGEKHRLSTVFHMVKFEQMKVAGEEGHVIALWEGKGVVRNKDGHPFGEGLIDVSVGYLDFNPKTGVGSGYFYDELTDRDGNKIYTKGEGKMKKGDRGPYWEGAWTITGGTGKYEGVRGGAAWKNYPLGGGLAYADWELDVELRR
jgi:hypothetical protein